MKSIERELRNCVEATEKMSGFDSDAEGDMDFFDGDEMNSFDGDDMSYAGGSPANPALSDPYVMQYQNTTTNDVTAYLFGYNDNFNQTNFGNPTAVVITNLQTGTIAGYGRMIAQSANKQFKIGKWRFQSATSAQLQQTLQIYHVDANGKTQSTPLNLSIMKDSYQQQSDVLDVTKTVTVDGDTYISFTLKASATLVIAMFPVAIVSEKARLNGGNAYNTAKAPRLSGKNTAPVVIQTSSGVKGITS